MRYLQKGLVFALAFLGLLQAGVYGDVVKLLDGGKIEGTIIHEDDEKVRIRTTSGIIIALHLDVVESIEYGPVKSEVSQKKERRAVRKRRKNIHRRTAKATFRWGNSSSKKRRNSTKVKKTKKKSPKRKTVQKKLKSNISERLNRIFDDPNPKAMPWDMAKEVVVGRYRLRTNLKAKYARIYGVYLNMLYRKFCKVFNFPEWKYPSYKCRVWIFATKEDYQNYMLQHQPSGLTSAVAFFQAVFHRVVAYHGRIDPWSNTFNSLAHECAHQFQDLVLRWGAYTNLPIWLSEGLAGFFESMYYNGKKLVLGKPSLSYLVFLKRDLKTRPLPLSVVFRTPQRYFTFRHYAYAWGFVYWLVYAYNGKNKSILDRLWNTCRRQKLTYERLLRILGVRDLDAVEKEWRRWILALPSPGLRKG